MGFFKGMSPADHYIFQYLIEYRNVTEEAVTSVYLPQLNYWQVGLLFVFLWVTDILRYKPVIIIAIFAGILYSGTLRWTTGEAALYVSRLGTIE